MKLKYRLWQVQGPISQKLPSPFPMDMLRYDPAYIKKEDLADPVGKILLYAQIPGYKSSIMNPTAGRWESFGWKLPTSIPVLAGQVDMNKLSDWVTFIRWEGDTPIFMGLDRWVACKSMHVWQQECFEKRRLTHNTNIL